MLKEPGRKNTSDSYMWVYCSIKDAGNPIRYFEYQPGRGGKYPEASKSAEAILRLNQLFDIESELVGLSPDQKKKERFIREKPLIEALWPWAEKNAIGELPKSKLSKVFHYALNRQKELAVFRQPERGGSQCRNLYTVLFDAYPLP